MSGSPLDAMGVLHVVEQIMAAGSHRERAALLLRVPDAMLPGYAGELIVACISKGFAQAEGFLHARLAALTAVRDVHGLLPVALALDVENWRVAFSKMAAGNGKEAS